MLTQKDNSVIDHCPQQVWLQCPPAHVLLTLGVSKTLRCAGRKAFTSCEWIRGNEIYRAGLHSTSRSPTAYLLEDGSCSLEIPEMKQDYTGEWMCRGDAVHHTTTIVDVLKKPADPALLVNGHDSSVVNILQDEKMLIRCDAKGGYPAAKLHLQMKMGEITKTLPSFGSSKLIVEAERGKQMDTWRETEVKAEQGGIIVCTAEHPEFDNGLMNTTVSLNVMYPARILRNKTSEEFSNNIKVIRVPFQANPPEDVALTIHKHGFEETILRTGDKANIYGDISFNIMSFAGDHIYEAVILFEEFQEKHLFLNYTLHVANQYGSDSSYIFLHTDLPEPLKMTAKVSSGSSAGKVFGITVAAVCGFLSVFAIARWIAVTRCNRPKRPRSSNGSDAPLTYDDSSSIEEKG